MSSFPRFSSGSQDVGTRSPVLPNFKMCSLSNNDDEDDSNSQDSGVGFDKMAFDFEPSPPYSSMGRVEKENTPEKLKCSFSLDDTSQDSGVYFEKDKMSQCSRRGLFRSPSDSSARLLAHKSYSFDVRPRPVALKRQECHDADDDTTPQMMKRRRGILASDSVVPSPRKITPVRTLQRCQSEVFVKTAMSRSEEQADLIGDYSKTYCLPLMPGRHQDLKHISVDTLKKLLDNEYSHVVEKYLIIDCRYPYEYNAGHIKDAKNIYTKEEIMEEMLNSSQHRSPSSSRKRTILIFHCEFSSERGPKLSRFLRNKDRDANKECYPSLHYPEVYLLSGGYKAFFESHQDMCDPPNYKPMLHEDHNNDLRHFRAKSKSWAGEKSRCAPRTGLRF
ncbi:hypothetical protein NP493_443g01003 [Ridgeia piscesae]|uniref:M-phase inducer phosphatase n=1 Tax=Ridgeia piscesae TaxID=27915 RepID=A0AAD9KZ92_RIDPI|nr:hypothetical protein NP493_443g01003 [Ridgeia piscesae]